MSQSSESILAAAEYVRDTVFMAECLRDTDGDGNCGRAISCQCERIRISRGQVPRFCDPLDYWDRFLIQGRYVP